MNSVYGEHPVILHVDLTNSLCSCDPLLPLVSSSLRDCPESKSIGIRTASSGKGERVGRALGWALGLVSVMAYALEACRVVSFLGCVVRRGNVEEVDMYRLGSAWPDSQDGWTSLTRVTITCLPCSPLVRRR